MEHQLVIDRLAKQLALMADATGGSEKYRAARITFESGVKDKSAGQFAALQPLHQKENEDFRKLFEKHRAWICRIADNLCKTLPTSVDRADLIQCGFIGLYDAWNSYRAIGEVPFRAYARLRIRGAMIDELRIQSRLPRRLWKELKIANRRRVEIENMTGRRARLSQVAAHSGLSTSELTDRQVSIGHRNTVSLEYAPEPIDTGPDAVSEIANMQLRGGLVTALAALPARERSVIRLYYHDALPQAEIGVRYGISEARVSQLRTQGLLLLRKRLASLGITSAGISDYRRSSFGLTELIGAVC
jgi:RNA polymerase sigma factor for flagellar operon FliA